MSIWHEVMEELIAMAKEKEAHYCATCGKKLFVGEYAGKAYCDKKCLSEAADAV